MSASSLPLGTKDLPPAPPFRRLIGPSFILLGLGLGSGEVILWPYLASNHGLGLVWGMAIGITMQFFINMEVERYAIIFGESIFVGFARLLKWLPIWFIVSTFLGFGWPGIGLTGATLLGSAFSLEGYVRVIAIAVFIGIGLLLTLGRVLYKTVERIQMILISVGVPFILLLTVMLAKRADYAALAAGLVGRGEGFTFLPAGIAIGSFLGALAYAGAGGNLNLAQSCYVRDKGYGMGFYADKITSIITGEGTRAFSLTGNTFPLTEGNLRKFRSWWRLINAEHALVFWFLGLFTMLTLSLLAYVTAYGIPGNAEGVLFVIHEALAIGERTLPFVGTLFLLMTGIMLLATQLTVLDSTSRIMTENLLLMKRTAMGRVSHVYYAVLWIQIAFGVVLFLLGYHVQPLALVTLGAVLNGFAMFLYTGLLLFFMNSVMPRELRPSLVRSGILLLTFIFLGVFCFMTVRSIV